MIFLGRLHLKFEIAMWDCDAGTVRRPWDVGNRSGTTGLVLINIHGSSSATLDHRWYFNVRKVMLVNVYCVVLQNAILYILKKCNYLPTDYVLCFFIFAGFGAYFTKVDNSVVEPFVFLDFPPVPLCGFFIINVDIFRPSSFDMVHASYFVLCSGSVEFMFGLCSAALNSFIYRISVWSTNSMDEKLENKWLHLNMYWRKNFLFGW